MKKNYTYIALLLHIATVQNTTSHPKIIIHTDINKTIIAEDPAGEKLSS